MIMLAVAAILLALADVALTWLGLRRGHVELNPLMRVIGLRPLMVLKLVMVGLLAAGGVLMDDLPSLLWLLAICAAPVIWNCFVLIRRRLAS